MHHLRCLGSRSAGVKSRSAAQRVEQSLQQPRGIRGSRPPGTLCLPFEPRAVEPWLALNDAVDVEVFDCGGSVAESCLVSGRHYFLTPGFGLLA